MNITNLIIIFFIIFNKINTPIISKHLPTPVPPHPASTIPSMQMSQPTPQPKKADDSDISIDELITMEEDQKEIFLEAIRHVILQVALIELNLTYSSATIKDFFDKEAKKIKELKKELNDNNQKLLENTLQIVAKKASAIPNAFIQLYDIIQKSLIEKNEDSSDSENSSD